jgi:methyl-accepting chemotaxis protein
MAMLGFGVVIGAVFPFAVDPFVAWVPGRRIHFAFLCIAAGLTVGGIGFLIVWRIVLRRFSLMADNLGAKTLAEGDLTVTVPVESSDAIGRTAQTINAAIENLREIASTTQRSTTDIDASYRRLSDSIAPLLASVDEYRKRTDEIETQIGALDGGMADVVSRIKQISGHMEENAAAILEQEANIQEIDGQADEVIDAIAETASSVDQFSASIRQVADSSASMSAAASATLDLVEQMTKGVEQIQTMVGEADRFSNSVVGEAKTGTALVARVIEAMGSIDERERESSLTLEELRRASDSVGEIVIAMRSIAGQTGLLALNASIIAAQAGEEGRSFAVVANSIRGLSDRSSASAREAGEILGGIREGIGRAFAAAEQSRDETAKGVNLSAEAGEALEKIVAMIRQERERVASIGEVSGKQAEHNRLITEAMERVSTMTGQVAGATSEESRGVVQIGGTVERLRELAGLVKRALAEQRKTSRQLADATDKIAYLVNGAVEAQSDHAARMRRSLGLLEGIRRSADSGKALGESIGADVAYAGTSLEKLKASVRRFKL